MKKDFKQELTELINKHGLEKEMRDTPDYILAEICIDAMAVFTEAIARRDEWNESQLPGGPPSGKHIADGRGCGHETFAENAVTFGRMRIKSPANCRHVTPFSGR